MTGNFPQDELRQSLRRLVRLGGLLEPHQHAGLQMSMSEVMALGELDEVQLMSQQELGQLLALEKSTVSRLAAGLERRGWISRRRDPANRRFYQLELTDEGHAVAQRVGKELHQRHEQLLTALTPAEREALTVGLAGLSRVLQANQQPHPPVSS
jgi:DNA-binding MarR family transcriptional regulator